MKNHFINMIFEVPGYCSKHLDFSHNLVHKTSFKEALSCLVYEHLHRLCVSYKDNAETHFEKIEFKMIVRTGGDLIQQSAIVDWEKVSKTTNYQNANINVFVNAVAEKLKNEID